MGRSKPRTNKRPPPKLSPITAAPLWTPSALSQLDGLPKLTQSQLTAIADAAAGVGEAPGNLAIDLPASLAALFEAKLTLDREKAKLMRMQKELKGYREGAAAAKGKEVAEECTCGRQCVSFARSAEQSHSPVYEEYSDEECYNCECDCHYVECDHDDEDYEHTCGPIPNPYLQKDPPQMTYQQALDAYRDERDSAARGLDEIGGIFKAAGLVQPPKPLADDPERLVRTAVASTAHRRTKQSENCSIGSRQWCGPLSRQQ